MKIELKEFQSVAAAAILARLEKSANDYAHDHELWAVSLSAPTGAGKTVIAASVIEGLFDGYDANPVGDQDAVVLWLTDQPSLNEQTKRKMIGASSVLGPERLETITPSFKAPPSTAFQLPRRGQSCSPRNLGHLPPGLQVVALRAVASDSRNNYSTDLKYCASLGLPPSTLEGPLAVSS